MTDQTALTEETTCPVCLQPYTPERIGDTSVCDTCWPSDDRTEAAMLDDLGDVPWTRAARDHLVASVEADNE